MQDRVPLYPGRVKLVPVAGQENTYDMTRADQPTQIGDPLNKATFWSDATAALFGLGADSVPNDGFAYLGKYAQHWWMRRTAGKYTVKKGTATRLNIWQGTASANTNYNHYSDSLNVSQSDGSFSLATDATLQLSVNTYQNANQLRGKYFYCTAELLEGSVTQNKIYFVPLTASAQISDAGSSLRYISIECQEVSTEFEFGKWEYVQSSSRSAYPDSGEQDGYEYEYLGIPFDNAVNVSRIEFGTYEGKGTYNMYHPNSITFGFKPKVWWVYKQSFFSSGANQTVFDPTGVEYISPWGENEDTVQDSGSFATYKDTTVTWYNNKSADNQNNVAGRTYYYLALG